MREAESQREPDRETKRTERWGVVAQKSHNSSVVWLSFGSPALPAVGWKGNKIKGVKLKGIIGNMLRMRDTFQKQMATPSSPAFIP